MAAETVVDEIARPTLQRGNVTNVVVRLLQLGGVLGRRRPGDKNRKQQKMPQPDLSHGHVTRVGTGFVFSIAV